MAVIVKNKYYLYSLREFIGGVKDRNEWGAELPDIQFLSEGNFWKFFIDINGKKEKFYIKKGGVKKYELQAVYRESFYNYKLNGHCYIRPEMKIRPGDVVVDAGGCEGFYTRYALSMGAAKVVIFEPCPELAEGLKKTFQKEINEERVLIIEKALGKKEKKDMLYIDQKMLCSSSIVIEDKNAIEKEVLVVSLDEALKEVGIRHIDVLKMDIEGAEVDAVIGARKIIRKSHPRMIIATYHSFPNAMKIQRLCKDIYHEYRCKVYGCYQFEKPYRPYITFMH